MEQTALTALHLGCGPGQPPWSKAYGRFGPRLCENAFGLRKI
jgi:hypothetical protein